MTIEMVREFQKAFGLDHEPGARVPEARTRLVRQHLMLEETSEFIHAALQGDLVEMLDGLCDMQYILDGTAICCGRIPAPSNLTILEVRPRVPNLELLDNRVTILVHHLAYIHLGMSLPDKGAEVQGWLDLTQLELDRLFYECGMLSIKAAAFAEVHRSNMSKLVNGMPMKDGSGRVLKGPGYSRPNLAQFLEA